MELATSALVTARATLLNQLPDTLAQHLDLDQGVKPNHGRLVAVMAERFGRVLGPRSAPHLHHTGLPHDLGGLGEQNHLLHAIREGSLTGAAKSARAAEAR